MPEANILNFVHEMCLGDVPRLLHYYSVLPRPPPDGGDAEEGRRRSFAFGERDGKGSLFSFEQRAFSMACGKVVDEIDIELSERAFAVVKATTDASLSGGPTLDSRACRSGNVRVVLRGGGGGIVSRRGSGIRRVTSKRRVYLLREGVLGDGGLFRAKRPAVSRRRLAEDRPGREPGYVRGAGVGGEQYFAGGDFCAGVQDESKNRPTGPGRARRSVVRWQCAPDGKERISSREPRTCEYDITVFTPALC
jgi:hypothetical protein